MKKLVALLFACILAFSICGCSPRELGNCTYEIEAEYLDNGVIGAHMRFTYVCDIKEGTDILKFNLFPNAFRNQAKITPLESGQEKYGEINIISVKASGEELKTEICGEDENILKVNLPCIVCYGEEFELDIEFGLVFPSGSYRFAKGENTVNVGNWHPVLCVYENGAFVECEYYKLGDPFYQDVADYKISLTVPSSFVVASSASATSCDVEGGKTCYSYELKNARDFAFCLSDKFNVTSKNFNGVDVNYYYYNDEEAEKTVDVVGACLNYFSENFGEYPFNSFSVAQSNFNEGGMEYSGLVFVNDRLNLPNKLYTAVHETAHQWWFGVVGNNQLDEAYLDEGLTEYSTAIFFDEHKEFGVDAQVVFDNAKKLCASYDKILTALGESADFKMVKHLKDFNGEMEYVNATYNRGLTMMKSVEDAIGRKKTVELLAKYFKKHKFSFATTESFLQSLSPAEKILSSYISGQATV